MANTVLIRKDEEDISLNDIAVSGNICENIKDNIKDEDIPHVETILVKQ